MTKQDPQKIYFDLYDQLQEPYRIQAKINWDYKRANLSFRPKNIMDALNSGFTWFNAPQGFAYWNELASNATTKKVKTTVTRQQVADWVGCDVKELEIKD